MARSKVRQLIKNLGAEKLTEDEIRIITEHHEYHGDKKIRIIGRLPENGVFVRVINHMGQSDSVIDYFCYKNDCSEYEYVRNASEEKEIDLIKRWLKDSMLEDEFLKLKEEGKI